MKNFLKGIVIGLGAIAPGLSGSILLVIFGLYQKTIMAISMLFKDFKRNVKFLLPLGCGILLGIILFSKLVDYLLGAYEMQTRFAFFGLILGSVPLFYREVRKKGFHWLYYVCIVSTFALGMVLFNFNSHLFPRVTNPNFFQSCLLGLVVAASYIVPGVDSAAILSALGLYDLWVSALANLDLTVLVPAALGVGVGVLVVSVIIHFLIAKCYTLTFSLIFGLFLSTVPSVLSKGCVVGLDWRTLTSVVLLVVSFLLSMLFSNFETVTKRRKKRKKS